MKGKTPLQKKHPRCYSLDTLPLSTSTLTLFSFNKTCSSIDKILAAGNKILLAVEHVLSAVEQLLSAAQKHRLTVAQILFTAERILNPNLKEIACQQNDPAFCRLSIASPLRLSSKHTMRSPA